MSTLALPADLPDECRGFHKFPDHVLNGNVSTFMPYWLKAGIASKWLTGCYLGRDDAIAPDLPPAEPVELVDELISAIHYPAHAALISGDEAKADAAKALTDALEATRIYVEGAPDRLESMERLSACYIAALCEASVDFWEVMKDDTDLEEYLRKLAQLPSRDWINDWSPRH